jgi:hypothetical protein
MTYSLSPSRLLSIMDPLLNLGILWRCLAAYVGIDFRIEADKHKSLLNLDKTPSESNIMTAQKNTKLTRGFSGRKSKFTYSKSETFTLSSPLQTPPIPLVDVASTNNEAANDKSESTGK